MRIATVLLAALVLAAALGPSAASAAVTQPPQPKSGPGGSKPVTELVLTGDLNCPTAKRRGKVVAAGKRSRRLWGSGHGRFRTRGRNSSATVRGTVWLTEDRCDGTYTRVKRGVVAVDDFVKDRSVVLRAGKSYFAAARAAAKRKRR
jgi:hypothetical protein